MNNTIIRKVTDNQLRKYILMMEDIIILTQELGDTNSPVLKMLTASYSLDIAGPQTSQAEKKLHKSILRISEDKHLR